MHEYITKKLLFILTEKKKRRAKEVNTMIQLVHPATISMGRFIQKTIKLNFYGKVFHQEEIIKTGTPGTPIHKYTEAGKGRPYSGTYR